MATREVLARLTAGTVDPSHVPGSHSHESLTASDVAAALAGLRRGQALLLLHAYVGDRSAASALQRVVLGRVLRQARREGWKVPVSRGPAILRGLADLAIAEVVAPPRCPRCRGTGEVVVRKLRQSCSRCEGTGLEARSVREKARWLGVSRGTFDRTWSPHLEWAVSLLRDWESGAIAHVRRRLG